jgi:hypothetical protein
MKEKTWIREDSWEARPLRSLDKAGTQPQNAASFPNHRQFGVFEKTPADRACGSHFFSNPTITQDGGEALGEKQRERVGARLVQNFSGMSELRDSRSNIRTALFRNTPGRRKNRPRLRNRCTLLLPAFHTASPCL